jgi:hypothetical protein
MTRPRLPTLADFANAEHFVLEDVTAAHPMLAETLGGAVREAREISQEVVIRDRLRGRLTAVRIYAEGWMDVEEGRRGKRPRHYRFDLRYLDPKPRVRWHRPARLLKAAGILGAVTAVFSLPALFGLLSRYTVPAATVAALATLGALFCAYYFTHEKIFFQTLKGRAAAIRLGAGLGTIRRFHRLVPKIASAIERAAASAGEETAVYLRAEMREHYRLRGEGILSDQECATSTGRILSRFDAAV